MPKAKSLIEHEPSVVSGPIQHIDYRSLLRNIEPESVDLVLSDPPYGINWQFKARKTPCHDVLLGDGKPFSYERLAHMAYRILKPNTAIMLFTGWSTYPVHYQEVQEAGFKMKEPLIVQSIYRFLGDQKGSFGSNSEWCIFGHKGRFHFKPTQLMKNPHGGKPAKSKSLKNPKIYITDVYKTRMPACWFGNQFPWATEPRHMQKKLFHPTIKSRLMIEWLIRMTTNEGDLVVDPFAGTGTVAAVCQMLNRRCISGDLHKPYVDLANSRLARRTK